MNNTEKRAVKTAVMKMIALVGIVRIKMPALKELYVQRSPEE